LSLPTNNIRADFCPGFQIERIEDFSPQQPEGRSVNHTHQKLPTKNQQLITKNQERNFRTGEKNRALPNIGGPCFFFALEKKNASRRRLVNGRSALVLRLKPSKLFKPFKPSKPTFQ
jgi:hypothetical protein